MASYYKFAERQADSFVNWAEIGKGITDMIQTEVTIRDQKKAAIDQATRDNLKRVAEAPVGSHEGLNTWTLNYADDARQAILLQDRLLKSGALKLKDYTIMRQNLNDGTDELFGVIKNFQSTFKDKRDRLISNDPKNKSQAFEMDLMAYSEQFGDFSKSMAIIDPRNFSVNVGLMEPDPNNQGVMKVGKQIATSSFLRKIQDTKVDYFDSDGAAEAVSKSFGGFTESTIQDLNRLQGKVVTVEDVRKRPGYEDAINEEINSLFANPFNITSVLTNDLVKDKANKSYVSNISGKDGNVIKYVFDPQTNFYRPDLTSEQVKAARDYMRSKIERRLDIKLKEDPFNKPQPNVVKAEAPTPTGPVPDYANEFLTRVRERTGLSEDSFVPSGSQTARNLQGVLATIPGGTQFSVAADPRQDGLVNLMQGDQIVKSFDVYRISEKPGADIKYLNEFQEIISNLAGTNGMVDYLSRTGGMGGSGSGGRAPAP